LGVSVGSRVDVAVGLSVAVDASVAVDSCVVLAVSLGVGVVPAPEQAVSQINTAPNLNIRSTILPNGACNLLTNHVFLFANLLDQGAASMSSSLQLPALYRIWRKRLAQLNPDSRYESYRLTNMLLLVVGMYKAGSVHLSMIARQLPIRAQKLSLVRRLRRMLANGSIRVREWYKPVAVGIIKAAACDGQVHLLIDGTKVGSGYQLIMVGIAYRRRALPLAWTWMRVPVGHSTAHKQIALLAYVHSLIPPGIHISLAGDSEFGGADLIRQLNAWSWDYVLRQRGSKRFMPYQMFTLFRIDRQNLTSGDIRWLGRVNLTSSNPVVTNLVMYWARGESEPWYLATSLPSPHGAIRLYRRRMWIEEMFGDMKGHGFDLESSRLGHFLRLSRLTLIVCLLYLWLIAVGEHVISTGQASQVDRSDRRDLSIFRIGWDFIERRLVLNDPVPAVFLPVFTKVSGG
jgi:hypothetical protein